MPLCVRVFVSAHVRIYHLIKKNNKCINVLYIFFYIRNTSWRSQKETQLEEFQAWEGWRLDRSLCLHSCGNASAWGWPCDTSVSKASHWRCVAGQPGCRSFWIGLRHVVMNSGSWAATTTNEKYWQGQGRLETQQSTWCWLCTSLVFGLIVKPPTSVVHYLWTKPFLAICVSCGAYPAFFDDHWPSHRKHLFRPSSWFNMVHHWSRHRRP